MMPVWEEELYPLSGEIQPTIPLFQDELLQEGEEEEEAWALGPSFVEGGGEKCGSAGWPTTGFLSTPSRKRMLSEHLDTSAEMDSRGATPGPCGTTHSSNNTAFGTVNAHHHYQSQPQAPHFPTWNATLAGGVGEEPALKRQHCASPSAVSSSSQSISSGSGCMSPRSPTNHSNLPFMDLPQLFQQALNTAVARIQQQQQQQRPPMFFFEGLGQSSSNSSPSSLNSCLSQQQCPTGGPGVVQEGGEDGEYMPTGTACSQHRTPHHHHHHHQQGQKVVVRSNKGAARQPGERRRQRARLNWTVQLTEIFEQAVREVRDRKAMQADVTPKNVFDVMQRIGIPQEEQSQELMLRHVKAKLRNYRDHNFMGLQNREELASMMGRKLY